MTEAAMADSSSKRRKAEENDGGDIHIHTDRISSLPDSVLLHILSFLSTKTCVSTMSLVSRRWRHLWEHLQVFDFCDDYVDDARVLPQQFQVFAIFVNAVLNIRRSRHIRKMRLSCAHSQSVAFSANSINTWIRTAIGPHLEDFQPALFSIDGFSFHLPLTVLTCPNLVSLSLCGDDILVELERSSGFHLPSLKTLQIDIGYLSVTSVDIILSGVKHLVLLRSTTKWLFSPPVKDVEFPELDFPEFRHLLHLELILPAFNSRFLFHVLQKCPMLQTLIVHNTVDLSSRTYGCAAQPESVPNCQLSQLTFIHLKGYLGYLDDMKFAGYVLQNGLVLKTMLIFGLRLDRKGKWDKHRILKKFSNMPRGSAICQLKFD